MPTIQLTVNGKPVTCDVENRRLLVEVLRNDLGLTGTHVGCDTSQCGCCTVLLDGQAVKACATLAVQADGGSRSCTRSSRRSPSATACSAASARRAW
jgi:carbon-monoxide dehydrogenase small subunit